MIQRNRLIQFYIAQYERVGAMKPKNKVRFSQYEVRLDRLRMSLHRSHTAKMGQKQLEECHRQIRNLVYPAYHYKNRRAIGYLKGEIIPQLVRLDLALMPSAQREQITPEFLDYAAKNMEGAICRHTLSQVLQTYQRQVIRGKILDLVPARPEMEFPEALAMKRHFILHIGPTNSGKTFQALSRLKDAANGVYLGPLRLLALEVYEKMGEYGTPCTMLTGQECIEEEDSRVVASTIEMADLNQVYDVAVIDEAQMIADVERGHSWTRSILGLQAEEIHMCMSPVAEDVITHLIDLCHDTYEIHRYERKTALLCEDEPFIFPDDVQQGDALVVFSKKSVLDVAGRLEEQGIEASVIYGSLPPEIRRRQMRLFTSGQTKVVVSTDAIGMGLNLPVRRIVFIQTEKFDGTVRRPLNIGEIKQIAGRAGRFGIYDTGYINAMGAVGLEYIRERYEAEEDSLTTVSLGFPQVLLDLPDPLDAILNIWHSVEPSPPFEKVNIEEPLYLYEQAFRQKEFIEEFEDKHVLYRMITCPIDIQDRKVVNLWLQYCMSYTADVSLAYPRREYGRKSEIVKYETYYKQLDLYYQFSYRFGKIMDTEWLEQERERTETAIMQYLSRGKKNYIATCRYCGRQLPVGSMSRSCDKCRRSGQRDMEPRYGHRENRRR